MNSMSFSSFQFNSFYASNFYRAYSSIHQGNLIEDSLNNNLSSISSLHFEGKSIDIEDLVKCYICHGDLKSPKMCKFCHLLACSDCIRKLLEHTNKCAYCSHTITRFDFMEILFLENVQKLIDGYKYLKEKKTKSERTNEKLKKRLNFEICNKHNEKILYYCFNCNKKLCGKCTSFVNKEAKLHEFHKIFEISEIEKTKYLDTINFLEKVKENILEMDKKIEKCEEITKNNNKKLEKEKYILNLIYKEIENNYIKKNQIISGNSEKLINIQKQFNNKLNNITNKLQEIQSLDKPITNLNINKEKKDIEKLREELLKEEQIINNDFQKNIFVEFKSFNYILNKSYENIINEKTISINIKCPLNINFTFELINNDILYILFPLSLLTQKEILSIKRKIKINLFPILHINDKIKEFNKEKKFIINRMIIKNKKEKDIVNDEEDNNKNINIINSINNEDKNKNLIIESNFDYNNDNDNMKYVVAVKLSDLIKGNNRFELLVYYYYFYD